MGKALTYFWTHQRPALLLAVGALCLAGYFAFGFVADAVYFNDPRHKNQALEEWMTLRYVSMSYRLPPEVLDEAVGFDGERGGRVRLVDLSAQTGMSLTEMHERILAAQDAFRAERGKQP